MQKLYKIGINGEWLNYNNQPVKLNQGQTIYAKGIDKFGNETRIIPSYTAYIPDSVSKEAFDNNDMTYDFKKAGNYYISIDSSIWRKKSKI
ncbi:hypothetical protein D3C71_1585940 [compost metagenome]